MVPGGTLAGSRVVQTPHTLLIEFIPVQWIDGHYGWLISR
jgi:hypothetical protein